MEAVQEQLFVILSGESAWFFRLAYFASRAGAESKDMRFEEGVERWNVHWVTTTECGGCPAISCSPRK